MHNFEGSKICTWHLGKDVHIFNFAVYLCPSYGMYPDKGIFEDEHFTDSKVTTMKDMKFMPPTSYVVS